MPDENNFDDGKKFGIAVNDFTKGDPLGHSGVSSQSEMAKALARMADLEVRARFEWLLKELGYKF